MKRSPIKLAVMGALIGAVSLISCSETAPTDNIHPAWAAGYDCQTLIVDDLDGFVNVRVSPQVKQNNVVRSLFNGTEISALRQQHGWLQIEAPIQGWVARNRTAVCCASHSHMPAADKLRIIHRLGQRAGDGDFEAAESLIKFWTDGADAEAQAAALAEWAGANPQFLISVLSPQSPDLRREVLMLLDNGLGEAMPQARQNFEAALEQLPTDHPILQEWENR